MPVVPRSLRHRWLLVYLGVFALIGQLMLPTVHAQNLAQRSGNSLFAAFCGEVAPQRLAALQQQLQANLQHGDEASQSHLLQAACPVCASLHAAQLATPPVVVLPAMLAGSIPTPVLAVVTRVAPWRILLPPLRGPPKIS